MIEGILNTGVDTVGGVVETVTHPAQTVKRAAYCLNFNQLECMGDSVKAIYEPVRGDWVSGNKAGAVGRAIGGLAEILVGTKGIEATLRVSTSKRPSPDGAANTGRAIPFGPASDDAWRVLNRVDAKGSPLPGYKGGKVWDNNGTQGAQILPRSGPDGSAVTYREWDLTQKVKNVDRDGRRLVTGSDGSAYYTTDHYVSFIQIR